jgi:hypothetical protein
MEELEFMESQVMNADFWQLLIRFVFNAVVTGAIVGFLYYPKCRRRDYSFTFMLISISIFMMIFLLGSVKVKIGFALGLFAIFGIIRYRTEQMPVREMTYLFVIIALSVINALSVTFSWAELVATNMLFFFSVMVTEWSRWLRHVSTKTIKYDRIELITPERRAELMEDLTKRTGLSILKVEVGDLDLLKDMAILRISYEPENHDVNTTDGAIIK